MDLADIQTKIDICRHLHITPFFVVRMLPKSYVNFVYQQGGIVLLLEHQLYPHGQHRLAKEVKDKLLLKVECPEEIYDSTLQRLKRALSTFRARRSSFQRLLRAIAQLHRPN